MSRTRRALAAVACLCLLPAGGPARAEAPVLRVQADRAAYARFHLDTDTTLSFDDARVLTDADYAGVALYSDDGRLRSGVLTVPAMSAGEADLDPVILAERGEVVLPRGWYRVVVLTNGRTDIRVPLRSGSGAHVIATTPHRQSFDVRATTLTADVPVTEELRAPLPRGPRTDRTALLARLSPAVVAGKFDLTVCAAARANACTARDTKVTMSGGQGSPVNVVRMIQAGLSTTGLTTRSPRDAVARVTVRPLTSLPFSFAYLHWSDPRGPTPSSR